MERCLDPRHAPNLLLTDMSMEELSGVSVCSAILARTNRVAILAITSFSLRVHARKAAEAGAQGIVSKSMETPIIAAIRRVATGGYGPRNHRAGPSTLPSQRTTDYAISPRPGNSCCLTARQRP